MRFHRPRLTELLCALSHLLLLCPDFVKDLLHLKKRLGARFWDGLASARLPRARLVHSMIVIAECIIYTAFARGLARLRIEDAVPCTE